ncbi:uncharacterized protein J3D65DRAFT_176259 [Phyllosticta citribraziliensis]|uniref:Uncharacterized protein n=1 Tax=Phyllosticta citribraziliensis TaxID=989973 RepID=A0ABR1L1Y5_9PEZI
MTLKLTSKFRSGRTVRSHRFDKLEDADAPAPFDSFNMTANLPATPDPYDRSESRSTARRSMATFQNLTFSDVQQLTNVLSHAPSPAISWQSPMWATYARFTRQQIESLPAHLRCKSNSPFSSRFWTASKTPTDNEGGLCKLHSQLNVDLIRSIFTFLQKEIEDHIPAILDPLSEAGRLTRQHEDVMNALAAVPALWTAAPTKPQEAPNDGPFRDIRRRLGRRDSMMSPNGTPRMYSMASSLQSSLSLSTSAHMSKLLAMSTCPAQFHKRSCLACAIAQVGSSPAIIFALRVGILARSQIEPNRRGVRITFVECWMEHLHSVDEEEVERVMRESFELGMQLRGLYRRLSIEKERIRVEDSEEPVDMTTQAKKGSGFWIDLGHKANCAWPFKTRGRGSNLSMFDLASSHSPTQRSVKPRGRSSNLSMFDLARSHSTHQPSALSKPSSTSRLRAIRAYSSSQLQPRPKTSYTLASRSQSVSSHHPPALRRPKTSFFHASATPFLPRSLSRRKTTNQLKTDSAALLYSSTPPADASPPMACDRFSKATQTSPRTSASASPLLPVPTPSNSSPPLTQPTVSISIPPRTSSRPLPDAYAWKTLPPLPPQHRARKRRHLSLPDALTLSGTSTAATTATTAPSPHPHPRHQHNHSHHLHPRHHHNQYHQRQRAAGAVAAPHAGLAFGVRHVASAAPLGPQMHVHPALRTRAESPEVEVEGEADAEVGEIDIGFGGGVAGGFADAAGAACGGGGGDTGAGASDGSVVDAGAGAGAAAKAKVDLSLFPRASRRGDGERERVKQRVRKDAGTGVGTETGKGGGGGQDAAWSCAVMKEMGM